MKRQNKNWTKSTIRACLPETSETAITDLIIASTVTSILPNIKFLTEAFISWEITSSCVL